MLFMEERVRERRLFDKRKPYTNTSLFPYTGKR
jgi:hypothetical protein